MMQPWRLLYRLLTPVVVGEYPITLDALAFAALFARSGDEHWALARLADYFRLTEGVPHASTLAFGRTRAQGLIALDVPLMSGLTTSADLSVDFIRPNGRYGGYSKVKTAGGPYKNRLDLYRGYWSPFVCFDFYGDRDRLQELLDGYVIGIGAHAQIGAGQVADPRFMALPHDCSLIGDDANAARPLARSLYTNLTRSTEVSVQRGRLLPPYWRAADQLVVQPQRIRIQNL